MTKKFGAQRKRAFLTYLAQSGNQTLSAERAKVSRSWVCLHRASDPAFDAACRAAISEAERRLESHPLPARASRESPSPSQGGGGTWRYHEGVELVVQGVGGSDLRPPEGERRRGRRVQVARARVRQWTGRVEKRFLSALAATCNVKAACREVGMWPPSAYNHRARWPAFAAAWDAAIEQGYVRLQAALVDAGCNHLRGHPGEELDDSHDVRIVEMTAEHAVAALNAYRKLMPPEHYSAGVEQRHVEMAKSMNERLWRKMELLSARPET